jgi:hypothetical protein
MGVGYYHVHSLIPPNFVQFWFSAFQEGSEDHFRFYLQRGSPDSPPVHEPPYIKSKSHRQ